MAAKVAENSQGRFSTPPCTPISSRGVREARAAARRLDHSGQSYQTAVRLPGGGGKKSHFSWHRSCSQLGVRKTDGGCWVGLAVKSDLVAPTTPLRNNRQEQRRLQ